MTLEAAKNEKLAAIQSRTFQLLQSPMAFNGVEFSMCEQSQLLWLDLKTSLGIEGIWPLSMPTSSKSFYTFDEESALAFSLAIVNNTNSICASDAALKVSVLACTTEEEVSAIIDNR
jgi:hypothetical protein